MGLLENEESIKEILRKSLRYKFKNYKPETTSMPFHTRLLGKDRMALFSFIQSINTNFGTSIFEPVALAIAKEKFKTVKTHCESGKKISAGSLLTIQKIMDNLITATTEPNKIKEIEMIRNVCQVGEYSEVKPTRIDIMLVDNKDEHYFIDLKTAKPNAGNFKEFKRTLLEWVGVKLLEEPQTKINTLIAIPYNPYEPRPYERWTIRGMLDVSHELKVAEVFWDFLGGKGTYEMLLNCFEEVGIELRAEIDIYFSKFK